MNRAVASLLLVVLAGCSTSGPRAQPTVAVSRAVSFRVVASRANAHPCVDPSDFQLAATEDAWIDVFDRETECASSPTVMLPEVDFAREAGLAVWWRSVPCASDRVRVRAVRLAGDELVVEAVSVLHAPSRACARATAESFLALARAGGVTGREGNVRLVLDGRELVPQGTPTP